MKSCEGHAWKQARPVVLKGTMLPRLRPLLHESVALCDLAEGRYELARQRATTRTWRWRGVHCWVKRLDDLVMILAMACAHGW